MPAMIKNMKNILLTIAYDGTGFCGWQRQPDQRSVQGEVEHTLSVVCAKPIQINGTSRTDAGVHAYGQRANFLADFSIPADKIPTVSNGMFASAVSGKGRRAAGDVAILSAEEVPFDFHARFHAIGKKYIYKIKNSSVPDPFHRNYCYQIRKNLDLDVMKWAAIHLTGTHDFKCFQAAGGKELESTVRTIYSIRIVQSNQDNIELEIIGDGFLYNMVRIITGTLVDVGLGKKKPEEIPNIISGRDRQRAGHTAPPQGLYLSEVFYENEKLREAVELMNGKENEDENKRAL